MASDWYPLPESLRSDGSPLLVQCLFESNRYTVHITDLRHLWSESLDREAIIRRAHDLRTSVDPEDGANQLAKLLEKLKAALRGEDDTELAISWGHSGQDLTVSSVSPLPKPLRPLRWSMYMSRLKDEAMRSRIVLPLMSFCFVQQKRIEELGVMLNEKDGAIGKILDKVESLGIDLANVFPHAGTAKYTKKKTQRDQAFKQVRGLAPFDRETWDAESTAALDPVPSFSEIARTVFNGSESGAAQALRQQLAFTDTGPSGKGQTQLVQPQADATREVSQRESQPDEFQHQATPPDSKTAEDAPQSQPLTEQSKRDKQNERQDIDEDTTEDEAEPEKLGANQMPTNVPGQEAKLKPEPSPRKLGLIGNAKRSQQSSEPELSDQKPQTGRGDIETTEVAITGHNGIRDRSGEEPPAKPLQQGPRKLGMIGGRKTESKAVKSDASNVVASPSKRESAASDGDDGNSDLARSEPRVEEESAKQKHTMELARDAPKKQPTPAPEEEGEGEEEEETAEARADRKRNELKREMQEKSKTTVKKKRRF